MVFTSGHSNYDSTQTERPALKGRLREQHGSCEYLIAHPEVPVGLLKTSSRPYSPTMMEGAARRSGIVRSNERRPQLDSATVGCAWGPTDGRRRSWPTVLAAKEPSPETLTVEKRGRCLEGLTRNAARLFWGTTPMRLARWDVRRIR